MPNIVLMGFEAVRSSRKERVMNQRGCISNEGVSFFVVRVLLAYIRVSVVCELVRSF